MKGAALCFARFFGNPQVGYFGSKDPSGSIASESNIILVFVVQQANLAVALQKKYHFFSQESLSIGLKFDFGAGLGFTE